MREEENSSDFLPPHSQARSIVLIHTELQRTGWRESFLFLFFSQPSSQMNISISEFRTQKKRKER
jgi:hypothetical protein